ncbi:MAG: DUF4221 family protein [Chitinophagaceae bacterium]|nr:DUF4221 family protein [Chitinophagaceae bacterium]
MSITKDSLNIPQGFFNPKFRVKNENGRNLLQGFNSVTNEMILFDIDSAKFFFKLKLNERFDNEGMGRLTQFDIYKQDTIFVVTEDHILILNDSGRIIYDKDLTVPVRDNKGEEIVFWDHFGYYPLFFDPKKQDLYLKTICNCEFTKQKYFERKVEAKLHLRTGNIDLLDYSFPQRHRVVSYGQSVFPFREVNGANNIISFESHDSLWVYDRDSDELKKYFARSRFQESDFIPFDSSFNGDLERLKEHLTINPLYEKILFDKFRNIYYRFYLKELPLKNEQGIYSNLLDRDLVIMVLDKDFNILDEKNVGHSILWYYSFVTEKGLYIRNKNASEHVKSGDYEHFTVFSWN